MFNYIFDARMADYIRAHLSAQGSRDDTTRQKGIHPDAPLELRFLSTAQRPIVCAPAGGLECDRATLASHPWMG